MPDTLWYDPATDRDTAKGELEITDSVDDSLIDDYGSKANRRIDNLVFGILDEIPTTDSAKITEDLKQAAILDIARRYKIKQKSFDAAKEYDKDFNDVIESVKIRAKASPSDRTTSVLVTSDPRDTKLSLPTQSSIFAFDDYA